MINLLQILPRTLTIVAVLIALTPLPAQSLTPARACFELFAYACDHVASLKKARKWGQKAMNPPCTIGSTQITFHFQNKRVSARQRHLLQSEFIEVFKKVTGILGGLAPLPTLEVEFTDTNYGDATNFSGYRAMLVGSEDLSFPSETYKDFTYYASKQDQWSHELGHLFLREYLARRVPGLRRSLEEFQSLRHIQDLRTYYAHAGMRPRGWFFESDVASFTRLRELASMKIPSVLQNFSRVAFADEVFADLAQTLTVNGPGIYSGVNIPYRNRDFLPHNDSPVLEPSPDTSAHFHGSELRLYIGQVMQEHPYLRGEIPRLLAKVIAQQMVPPHRHDFIATTEPWRTYREDNALFIKSLSRKVQGLLQ